MSVTADNVVQENANTSVAATSHVVSLPSGTTAGNTLLIYTFSASAFSAVPSGFTGEPTGGSNIIGVHRKSEIAAGETSWTFTTAGSADVVWVVKEMSNVDVVEPQDVTALTGLTSVPNGGTLSCGPTAQNAGLSVMVEVIYAANSGTTAWSGYTNNFVEVADVAAGGVSLAVARKFQDGTTATFSSTATRDSGGTTNATARVVAYRAADAPLAAPLNHIVTWGWGTHGGMGNGFATGQPQGGSLSAQGTWGVNYLIDTIYAIDGVYGLRLAPSASIAYVTTGNLAGQGISALSFGGWVRPVTATGTVVLAYVDATTDLQVVYDSSTTKIGLRWGTGGTPAWQPGTTALNTAVYVEGRVKTNTATWHADWWLDEVAQTSPADLSATASTVTGIGVGNPASQTMTADYGTWVFSRYYAAAPLGKHWGKVMVPATTGASVVGTSTNFSEFTANGTLAAFAATSGQRIDEVPPTISASADGVCQTAIAASDYMNFPMTDPVVASDEVFGGARAVIPTWGGTGTGTGTLGLRVSDGTTETVIDAGSTAYDGDSLTAVSSTYPIWRAAMITVPPGGWTLTKANGLVARVGYSSDATPDMGVHAFYIAYVVRKAIISRVHTIEDGVMTVDLYVNPYNSAAVSYVITNNDPTRTATFSYSIAGTPQTPVTVAPGAGPTTLTLNADAFGDISETTLTA